MIDLFWKRVINIWNILFNIELFYTTWNKKEVDNIVYYINELKKYDDEHTKMISGQLVRYSNYVLDYVIYNGKWDYKDFRFSL